MGHNLNPSDSELRSLLTRAKVIPVVGASRDPTKDSHTVPAYLQRHGFEMVPVNPFADEILGKKAYKSLSDLPLEIQGRLDIVDIFRPSEDVPPIVDQTIELFKKNDRPMAIWMQLGISNEAAKAKAEKERLQVVMDRCIRTEHRRLLSEPD
jgi:predicted CoA-binding protein